jgi:nucleoid DNA-binding protein
LTLDITAFIRELLFGHDCVIVPGFGGFIGNYTSARIDNSNSTFFPPVKQISFNINLNHNDGLLVGRISEFKGINYADARNLVEEFVKDVRNKLSRGERVIFINIGSFYNNHEGNLQFEPDNNANYHLDSYGLASFQFTPLEKYSVREKVLKYNQPVPKPSVRKIVWRAAVIIPLLATLVIVPLTTDIFKTKVQRTNFNPLANIEFENNRQAIDKASSADSSLNLNQVASSETTVAKVIAPVPVEEKSVPVKESEAIYALIAGSFKSEHFAALLKKKLEAEGYKPELMNGPDGFLRVCATKCSSLDQASNRVESIKKNYPGTWITKIR